MNLYYENPIYGDGVTVTASSSEVGFPAGNLLKPGAEWRAPGTSAQVVVSFPSPVDIEAIRMLGWSLTSAQNDQLTITTDGKPPKYIVGSNDPFIEIGWAGVSQITFDFVTTGNPIHVKAIGVFSEKHTTAKAPSGMRFTQITDREQFATLTGEVRNTPLASYQVHDLTFDDVTLDEMEKMFAFSRANEAAVSYTEIPSLRRYTGYVDRDSCVATLRPGGIANVSFQFREQV